jgi:hypothetical protein
VTGVVAKKPIGVYPYSESLPSGSQRLVFVEVFPLRVTLEMGTGRETAERHRRWFPKDDAAELVDKGSLAQIRETSRLCFRVPVDVRLPLRLRPLQWRFPKRKRHLHRELSDSSHNQEFKHQNPCVTSASLSRLFIPHQLSPPPPRTECLKRRLHLTMSSAWAVHEDNHGDKSRRWAILVKRMALEARRQLPQWRERTTALLCAAGSHDRRTHRLLLDKGGGGARGFADAGCSIHEATTKNRQYGLM